MVDLIEKLAKSGNKVLEAASNDFAKWSKLKHSKKDLEVFLEFNIAHLKFRPKNAVAMKEIVCTSNTKFISLFSALKASSKKRALAQQNAGISTKDLSSILTYNLIERKYNTIDLSNWELVSFITISEDNIEIIDKAICEFLKIDVENDLKMRS